MNEALEKAEQTLGLAFLDLRDALNKANAVEAQVLLPIMHKVGQAQVETAGLLAARRSI